MEFFNRKEEVIDIQLTQHGKYLLSKGRLSPKYYAFYDDDVVYDSSYAGHGESSSEAEGRMTTTPRVKTQYAFEGAETRISKVKNSEAYQQLSNDEKVAALEPALLTSTNITGLSSNLGTSAFNSSKAPAWNISVLDGYIEESFHFFTGSTKVERIPQLDIISTTKISTISEMESADEETLQLQEAFSDGSSFQVLSDSIILDIGELNSINRQFNFDVEVFEVETDENGNEELRQLKFPASAKTLRPGLSYAIGGEIVSNTIGSNAENQEYAHYYMDVSVDGEVQIDVSPSSTPQSTDLDPAAGFIPTNDFDCPDDEEEA